MNPQHKFALLLAVIGCMSIIAVKAQDGGFTTTEVKDFHGLTDQSDLVFVKEGEYPLAQKGKVVSADEINDMKRRLAGVQKQVTLLHSVKENKDPSKNLITAKNFNNLVLCVEGQKRAAAVNGKRIADLEKKVTHIVNILKLQRESGK